ncbi:MAG: hypothetical protein JXM68_00820 [Sedimentisphaerales bacterium]|nr:hypothetical protein [Sedimentisphaerales bacterium]
MNWSEISRILHSVCLVLAICALNLTCQNCLGTTDILPFPEDPQQILERTCFQTGSAWSINGNLRSDVAIVYGIDPGLPERIKTWRDRGYRIHVMTGVSWGNYQDYLYGRYDGINHEDEAQTERNGNKVSHGGDVYYMCPGINFGKFLCVGVQRALDAGAEAIHLEEPEFWVKSGYSEGFKREWQSYYNEPWQAPHSSVDAQWRASKLKYYLYRRALQQVFDYVQNYNAKTGKKVRCYVPTHSLINYAQWQIVSPESSLARLNGCDGYIAQVWTGTARESNQYKGIVKERTFETAFLEYGAMQNLVRATGRQVWYLNDPIEDNPNYDWDDYRINWESTLVASLLQPEVWRYEVAPWPERIFGGKYPKKAPVNERKTIPPAYATELQIVMNTLNDMNQTIIDWHDANFGFGLLVSDSLMFQRGEPIKKDLLLSNFYGVAMPFVKHGIPLMPVQLENLTVKDYLQGYKVLVLSYTGMKPLTSDVHAPLAQWVRNGGSLLIVDDDKDPYNSLREWWNSEGLTYKTPREHLFHELGLTDDLFASGKPVNVGSGLVSWLSINPEKLAAAADGDKLLLNKVKDMTDIKNMPWRESDHFLLRRGPYLIGAGLDESVISELDTINGRFVSLFDPELSVRSSVSLTPGSRFFLLDLNSIKDNQIKVLASACKTLPKNNSTSYISYTVEGIANTPAIVLMHVPGIKPGKITLDGQEITKYSYLASDELLWVKFDNTSSPRELKLEFTR